MIMNESVIGFILLGCFVIIMIYINLIKKK